MSTAFFQIPFASVPIRLIIGGACLLFVTAIFGSWVPRSIRWVSGFVRAKPDRSKILFSIVLVPIAVGLVPLVFLSILIRNPTAYVFDGGVVKEGVFTPAADRFSWGEIVQVTCGSGRGAGPRWFVLQSADGRKIGLGNPGGIDFSALHALLEDRLGPAVMQGCPKARRI